MTLHNRSPAHRQLKARKGPNLFTQIFPTTSSSPTDTPSQAPTPSPSTDPSPTPTDTPTTSETPKPPGKPTQNSSFSSPPTTTASPTFSKPTSTSAPQSSTSTSRSTSTSTTTTSTSTSSTATTIGPVTTITGAPKTLTQTNSFGAFVPTTTDYPVVSLSATSTSSPSSGTSTGTIVGGVAGGIAAIAIIGLIVAFFLRRWRRNRMTEEDFNPEDFIRGPVMAETGNRASTFDATPPNMDYHGHAVSPSIGSGANLAGQGAFPYNGSGGVQERQAYTYGQGYDAHAHDDEIAQGGAYSSEPQPQAMYNPEAYGSYAYSTEAQQPQPYHPYSGQEYQAHYQDNTPALVAGAPAVPAGRSTRSIDNNDAYGGI